MEMHQIRYFLAAARLLNFTRAAEECHVAQPSLTRAVKLLEAELGGDLFSRERNLTHLTEFGLRMLPLLQKCHDSAASAKELASSLKSGKIASLAVALSCTVPIALLLAPLAEILRLFPTLDLKLMRGPSAEVAAVLKRGEASVAMGGPFEEEWDRLDAWALFSEEFEAVLHPGHPLAALERVDLAELARSRLLARPYCECFGAFSLAAGPRDRDAGGWHAVGSDDDLVRLVEADFGVGVLPKSAPAPATLRRLPIAGLDLRRTISLYAVSGRERSAPATALLKLLRGWDWAAAAQPQASSFSA